MPASSPSALRSISIGGATFDLFIQTSAGAIEHDGQRVLHLPLGEKILAGAVHGRSGGGACNTSTGLARLGFSSSLCAVLGDDQWGHLLQDQLQKEGIHTDGLTIVEDETTSFSLIFSAADGERVIVYSAGTNVHLLPVTLAREAIGRADVVYLNHIQPASVTIEDPLLAALLAAKKPRLTWNPGGTQIEDGMRDNANRRLLQRTNILLLNKEEALAFAGVRGVNTALSALSQAGPEIVVITDGKHGALATDGKRCFHCPIAPAPVVDTTGAGDSFGTAVTWALATGHDLPTALLAGTINGASVVGAIGAQPGLLTDTQILAAIRSVPILVEETTL